MISLELDNQSLFLSDAGSRLPPRLRFLGCWSRWLYYREHHPEGEYQLPVNLKKLDLHLQIVWVEEHDKRSFLLDLMDASGLGAKDLDGEASRLLLTIIVDMI